VSEAADIYTPIRLCNKLSLGLATRPAYLILDEAHHSEADSLQALYAYAGSMPTIGLTATPFRGTPKGTAAFLAWWNDEIVRVMDYPGAVARGVLAFPTVRMVPLVDDDTVEVSNGELSVKGLTKVTTSRLGDLVTLIESFYIQRFGRFDMPTMVAIPSSEIARDLGNALSPLAGVVTQATTQRERQEIFKRTLNGEICLIHINVVTEGVDLPMRRLIDASPTLSPVRWQQQIGRIMRPLKPGEKPSEYICTNRNLGRHAYLLDGMVPLARIAEAQQAFGSPSKRDAARAIGLEALTRFKPTTLPLIGNVSGILYQLHAFHNNVRVDYAVLVHPTSTEPIYASRKTVTSATGELNYGRWTQIDSLPDLTGFASAAPAALSEKQSAWWKRSARRHGLDPDAKVDRKNFAALPVLKDLNMKMDGIL